MKMKLSQTQKEILSLCLGALMDNESDKGEEGIGSDLLAVAEDLGNAILCNYELELDYTSFYLLARCLDYGYDEEQIEELVKDGDLPGDAVDHFKTLQFRVSRALRSRI